MPSSQLWAGALSLLLRHQLTGCPVAARQAADILGRIADCPELDAETRSLCEDASVHLGAPARENAPCRRLN